MNRRALGNVLTIGVLGLRQFLRDRSNIFFVFLFPLLLVLVIGAQFGEGATTGRVAVSAPGEVSSSALHQRLVEQLDEVGLRVSDPSWDDAREQLARGRVDVAVRVDEDAVAAHESGEPVELEMIRGSSNVAPVAEQQVRTAVGSVRSERGQVLALGEHGVDPDAARAALADVRDDVTPAEIEVTDQDELSEQFAGLGQFDLGASGQLLLFVFLISLAGASSLIRDRRLGVVSRSLAAPVSTGQLIAGVTLGRWVIALFQGAYIMAASALLFDVDWGSLWLSLLVLAVFALVAAGAAMLLGTLLENEGAAVGIGVGLGLVLAALGGSMMPLEFFPDTMRTIANITPHSWAYQAFADIQRRGGTLADVAPQLGVLALMAAVLLALGAWSLRRSLDRAL